MAKQATNTFAAMNTALRSIGFIQARRGRSVVFTHPGGGPVILLPAYKNSEIVKPIHRMMVRRQLMDSGLVRTGIAPMISGVPAASKRPATRKAKITAEGLDSAGERHKIEA